MCECKGYKSWLWIAVLSMRMAQNLPMLDSKRVIKELNFVKHTKPLHING